MTGRPSFPSLLESFFRHRMAKQHNATPTTITWKPRAGTKSRLAMRDWRRCDRFVSTSPPTPPHRSALPRPAHQREESS